MSFLIVQFIFSTALDGKIKAWLYDNLGSRVDYDAPGHWCTTMAYSADGSRFLYFVTWFDLEYMDFCVLPINFCYL
jgi:hypothetical protein